MSEGPKLLVNKPKKAQRKQHQASASPSPSSSSSSSASASMATSTASSASAPASSPPPPPPPKESFARRYKFIWPLLLAVNFSIGAYLFMRTKKKDVRSEEEEFEATGPISTTATVAVTEKPLIPPPITEHIQLRDPIPEDKQRELFKWLLEEKRKIKPRDPEERKRIDEEKAILKQFIRAKSIPTL